MVDLFVAGGLRFVVCFCGRALYGDICETCGYATPTWRERHALDEIIDWKARGHAAHVRRLRQRHWRKVRAR